MDVKCVFFCVKTCQFWCWLLQQQDESHPGAQPADIEGDVLIQMVNKTVSSITTRLQSKYSQISHRLNVVASGENMDLYRVIEKWWVMPRLNPC